MESSDLHPVLFKCIPHAGNCQVCNINIYFSHLYMIIIVFFMVDLSKKNHPVCSLTLGYWVFQSKVLLCGCLVHSLNCLLAIGFGGSVYHLGVCYTFTD